MLRSRTSSAIYFSPNRNKRTNLATLIIQIFFQSLLFSIGTCMLSNVNLITNGNFSQPAVISQRTKYFNSYILGWNCTWLCQIKNCKNGRDYWLPQNKIDSNCEGQVIDLNSNYFNEKVSQFISLSVGYYQLHFDYFYPLDKANLKQLEVRFNNIVIFHFKPQVAASFDKFQFQTSVLAQEGINSLQFANLGYSSDGVGFKINNVSLYREIDKFFEQFVYFFFEKCSYTHSIPGARVIFRSTLSFLLNFDRYQLYIYHGRTYSYNEEVFLLSVNQFLNTKSTLATTILENVWNDAVEGIKQMVSSHKYKVEYIQYLSFNQNYHESDYLDNINQSFLKMLPFILVFTIVFKVFFKVSFQKPISLLFIKFDLWLIVLIMMFDGNIQKMTFSTFAQFKTFFSKCFHHKILNIFIVMFFFLLVFATFALFFWVKFSYRKKAKYLLEQGQTTMSIIWGIVIDRGIICFLFGTTHQLLLHEPKIQLVLLGFIQTLWIIKKMIYVYKRYNKQKLLAATSMISGLLRILFQFGCYFYENKVGKRRQINQELHTLIIYVIIGGALVQFIIGLFYCLMNLFKISALNPYNKIQNKNESAIKQINIFETPKTLKVQDIKEQNKIFYLYLRKGRPLKITKHKFSSKQERNRCMPPKK